MEEIRYALEKAPIGPVIKADLNKDTHVFDLSKNNTELLSVDTQNPEEYLAWKEKILRVNKATIGLGRYDEDRCVYRSALFQGNEPRSIHIGIDINTDERTEILCPIDGEIHSFKDNDNKGDYGPTIVLKHRIGGIAFHTLFGHLSRDSLYGLYIGKKTPRGSKIGFIGGMHENGGWGPHVHFQIIIDMEGKEGDYPGVCRPSERQRYMENCPDPNIILRIDKLKPQHEGIS